MDGVPASEVRDELKDIAARREEMKARLAAVDEGPPLLHPEMARIYRAKVTELASALQEPETRSEAKDALRGLVDAVVLTPDEHEEALQIELRGNLAAMLTFCGAHRGRRARPARTPPNRHHINRIMNDLLIYLSRKRLTCIDLLKLDHCTVN